jgi:dTDP-4-amino-4,6-dideoxygalactose transaminase
MSKKSEKPSIPFHRPDIGQEEIDAVVDTLRSGWLTMGPKTRAFEEAMAGLAGAKRAVAVNSATSGLHLGLDALGIGRGDEVLVPTVTFASTAATVIHAGATPRLVDCEADTLNIDVADAANKCNERTRAIVPVHYAGHPCDMDAIGALARERKLFVMEDAAHAPGARYRGRPIGSISDLTVFSFYATKNLTTGEGGMVVTDDDALADTMESRRLHGMSRDAWKRYSVAGKWRYDIAYPGFKYNMTDMNAALGLVQLKRFGALQERRQQIVERYRAGLADVDAVELPVCRPEVDHAWHIFIVRVRPELLRIGRDEIIVELNEAGIGTSVHFVPLHVHSYYREVLGYTDEDLPEATRQWQRIITLPLFSGLEDAEIDRITDTLKDVLRRHRR